jgi:hypothetical protein
MNWTSISTASRGSVSGSGWRCRRLRAEEGRVGISLAGPTDRTCQTWCISASALCIPAVWRSRD